MSKRLWLWTLPLVGFLLAGPVGADTFDVLRYDETTIADIQAAFKAKTLTCRMLVQMYLDRIDTYDKKGPALNAIVVINPDALKVADTLDTKLAQSGPVGPLHCVPLIVKDNYETTDMSTSAGSLSLKGVMSKTDAFQIKKLREAGALMLAKGNMAEFAFDPMETVNSLLPGYTRNPYALDRVTAGSSGGPAAAVAANFGAVGLGTDTGNSIRGPASHTSLVGIRSTMGLTSRDGIVPLFLDKDIGGPLARNVADAVAIFDVIAGYDPADQVTAASQGKRAASYVAFLDKDGVRGMRLGVVRQLFTPQNTDAEVMKRMEQALVDLERLGAQIVDPVTIAEIDSIPPGMLFCFRFKFDINEYLPRLAPDAQVKTLEDIIKSGKFHPSIEKRLIDRQAEPPLDQNPRCAQVAQNTQRMRESVQKVMDDHTLDALVYPTWTFPPRLIGDLNTPHGNNSPRLSPPTGFPAITVPMGFVRDGLPVGLQVLGRAWSEPTLIKIVYGYEQATRHRRPPASTPPLPARP
ncbi:MAG: amidase [Acetobacteraceae bacterium]|nr:amidase [Acetobacteraceae bacterium]